MNVTVRRDAADAQRLFEQVLREGAPIAAEYPLLFDAKAVAPEHAFATIESEGAVRSACALLLRNLVVRSVKLPVGLIGSVATHPDWRGRGLAARALAAAEDELRRSGALLAILWADRLEFYEKLGWKAFGAELDFLLPDTLVPQLPEATAVRERKPEDDIVLHELYVGHPERVERTLAETRALLECPGMDVLVCERWQKVVAYACLGRGRDLGNAIHEWAGDAQSVLALARAHLERRSPHDGPREIVLMAPPSAVDLTERLAALEIEPFRGILGMAKVLDPRRCAQVAARRLDRRGGIVVASDPAGNAVLRNEKGAVVCSPGDLIDLLFAARGEKTRAREVAEALGLPSERLPLEPFVWGLDSI